MALIYDYAKALDPNSAVREGEVEFAKSGSPIVQNISSRLQREFGWDGGGVLPPKARAYLRREIYNIARQKVQAYNQEREFFTQQARRFGVDPEAVIGPHAGAPYLDELREFNTKGERIDPAAAAAREAGQDYRPGPDEVALGMDLPGTQSSETGARLTPQQEAAIEAYVKANAGNPNFNEQQYQQFFRDLGIDHLNPTSDPAFYEDVRKGRASQRVLIIRRWMPSAGPSWRRSFARAGISKSIAPRAERRASRRA